jgi:hypothetical protein
MRPTELRIGRLTADGYDIQRSGIRWLKEHGQYCQPGEVIAYCNIGLVQAPGMPKKPQPFSTEMPDLQVAFATKIGGRLAHSSGSSQGGFFDFHEHYHQWRPEFIIGQIQPETKTFTDPADDPQTLRLFVFAGRRTTPLADVRSGLMCGWHSRSRVWSAEGSGPLSTFLSLGICEQDGVIRGDRSAFLEMLGAIAGPVQVVYMPENPLVPSACVLLEQIKRSPAQYSEIVEDLARVWSQLGSEATPQDWLFVGSLLSNLREHPILDEYEVITRFGLKQVRPADAVLLSINSESPIIFRHKRLGYTVNCHQYRISEVGPAVRMWLQTGFDRVRRTPEMIRCDLRDLICTTQERTSTAFLIMNTMSTSGYEDIFNYSVFDSPMGDVLGTYNAKEMNLMLHDLSRECNITIVDVDAIAADIGAEAHLPDGIHQSGPLQSEIRKEIIYLLAKGGVPGFSPA